MAIRENRVEAVVMTFMDMAGWDFWFRGISHKSGPEPGIIPSVNLFEAPDFCGAEAVKNSNRTGSIGHIGQVTTGIFVVIYEWSSCTDPVRLATRGVRADLCIGDVIPN